MCIFFVVIATAIKFNKVYGKYRTHILIKRSRMVCQYKFKIDQVLIKVN
jgi:hypothetical protein